MDWITIFTLNGHCWKPMIAYQCSILIYRVYSSRTALSNGVLLSVKLQAREDLSHPCCGLSAQQWRWDEQYEKGSACGCESMGINPLRELPLGNFFFSNSVLHTEQLLLMSSNVHSDQYLQQKALLSLSLVILKLKEFPF